MVDFLKTRRRPLLVAAAVLMGIVWVWQSAWPWFRDRYAPFDNSRRFCRLCGCELHEYWVWSRPRLDTIEPTECSRWVDSFLPTHEHEWGSGSSSHRSKWFDHTLIACRGSEPILWIHRLRGKLGEHDCRRLATRGRELIEQDASRQEREDVLDRFTDALRKDPEQLLDDEFGVTTIPNEPELLLHDRRISIP